MIDEWMMNVVEFHACLILCELCKKNRNEALNGARFRLFGWSMKVVTVDNLPATELHLRISLQLQNGSWGHKWIELVTQICKIDKMKNEVMVCASKCEMIFYSLFLRLKVNFVAADVEISHCWWLDLNFEANFFCWWWACAISLEIKLWICVPKLISTSAFVKILINQWMYPFNYTRM